MSYILPKSVAIELPKTGCRWRDSIYKHHKWDVKTITVWCFVHGLETRQNSYYNVNKNLKYEVYPEHNVGKVPFTFMRQPVDWYISFFYQLYDNNSLVRHYEKASKRHSSLMQLFLCKCLTANGKMKLNNYLANVCQYAFDHRQGFLTTLEKHYTYGVDLVGKTENLNDDFIRIMKDIGENIDEDYVRNSKRKHVTPKHSGVTVERKYVEYIMESHDEYCQKYGYNTIPDNFNSGSVTVK